MQLVTIAGPYFSLFVALGYINLCLNPFIYAARYQVVKQSWKELVTKFTPRSQA